MAFRDLVNKVFGASKSNEEYEQAMRQYENRQSKPLNKPAIKPKEKTVDEEIQDFQERQKKIRDRVAPFRR